MPFVSTELSLTDIVQIVPKIRMPQRLTSVREGWLTGLEAQWLYGCAYVLDGPFLEMGAWGGLSTSIITLGVKNSGRNKQFVTAELNPTTDNFKPMPGGMGFFHPVDSDICLGVVGMDSYNTQMKPVMEGPGGVLGLLQRNLLAEGSLDRVQISVGGFTEAPILDYNFIFSDIAHNIAEIDATLPHLLKLMRGRKVVFAAHDTTDEHKWHLTKNLPVVSGYQVDSLFFCEVDGTQIAVEDDLSVAA